MTSILSNGQGFLIITLDLIVQQCLVNIKDWSKANIHYKNVINVYKCARNACMLIVGKQPTSRVWMSLYMSFNDQGLITLPKPPYVNTYFNI